MSAVASVPVPVVRPDPASALRVRPVPHRPRGTTTALAEGPQHRPVPGLAERVVALGSPHTPADDTARRLEPTHRPVADPAMIAQVLCGALVEVCLGARAAGQLARWLAPGVLAQLRERAHLSSVAAPRAHRSPVVRRLVMCPLDQAIEVAAAVDDSRRTRAVALRLEPHRDAWRVTALELG